MPAKRNDEVLLEIEEAQSALRDSIERARDLAEETERLIFRHRHEAPKPLNPAS